MFKGNRNLLIIATICLVGSLGYGVVIPLIYPYSVKYGLTDFQNGLLVAVFSICQFIATPIIGRLSDKYGRKPLLVSSISGTVLSFLLMAYAPNAFFLFIARALDGITAGNIPVAMAVISDTTKPEERAQGFGIIGATFGLGFIFGPAIAGLLSPISLSLPFLVAAAISLVAVVMTALMLPETNQHMGEVKHGKLFDIPKLFHSLRDPDLGKTFIISLLFYFAFACSIVYGFQPFTNKALHLNATWVSILFMIFGLVGFFTQIFFVARFSKKLGMGKAFSYSILATAISFVMMFFSHTLPLFILASIVLGVFNSTVQTLLPTILSQEADAKSQGSIMGLNASYQSIGMIFGPIVGGTLATISLSSPFLAGGILIFLCYLLSFNILKKVHQESAF